MCIDILNVSRLLPKRLNTCIGVLKTYLRLVRATHRTRTDSSSLSPGRADRPTPRPRLRQTSPPNDGGCQGWGGRLKVWTSMCMVVALMVLVVDQLWTRGLKWRPLFVKSQFGKSSCKNCCNARCKGLSFKYLLRFFLYSPKEF